MEKESQRALESGLYYQELSDVALKIAAKTEGRDTSFSKSVFRIAEGDDAYSKHALNRAAELEKEGS